MGESVDRREAIRLAGVIRAVEPAPRLLRVKVDGKRRMCSEDGVLRVEVDGAGVTVELEGKALVDAPVTRSGAWGELAVAAAGVFPADLAPAFTSGTLAVTELAAGAPVAIYGEVLERAFGEDGGPRDAPTQRVTRVRGLIVCSGDGADGRLAKEIHRRFPPAARPARPSLWARWVAARAARIADPRSNDPGSAKYRPGDGSPIIAGLALVITLVLWLRWYTTASSTVFGYALATVVFTTVIWPTAPIRGFHARESRHGLAWHPGDGVRALWILAFGGAMAASIGESRIAFYASAVMLATSFFLGLLAAPTLAEHARLLRGRRWDGTVGGDTDIVFEGVVADPTPVTVGNREVAIGRGTGWDQNAGSNPDQVLWHRFHGDGSFLVRTDHGFVEVSPQQVVWATSISERVETHERGADYEIVDVIPVGARIIGAGRVAPGEPGGPPRLLARGTDPAVILATSSLGDPRGWVHRIAIARMIRLVLLAVFAVVTVRAFGWF